MGRIKFRDAKLSKANIYRLEQINGIIQEYQAGGYTMTLRQLYYQLVSRDVIPNSDKEYSKLSNVLKEGRMAGIVDWGAIEDRLRVPYTPASFDSPQDIVNAAINQYKTDKQEGQPIYTEVWVEKDALSGVLKRVTSKYHVPIMVNRGYSSVTAMYDAFMRFVNEGAYKNRGVNILYLGDFDPSGLDMIRDISTRLREFQEGYNDGDLVANMHVYVESIALTKEQIDLYNPPPNPAKITDPRAAGFIKRHGHTSWEVDALKPEVLNDLLTEAIEDKMNMGVYEQMIEKEEEDKKKLNTLKNAL